MRTHTAESLGQAQIDESVCLHGRLLDWEAGRGALADDGDGGTVSLRSVGPVAPHASAGDIVEIHATVSPRRSLVVHHMEVLAPQVRSSTARPQAEAERHEHRHRLHTRARVLAALREFFTAADFLEVETPALVRAPGQDAHITPIETAPHKSDTGRAEAFMITSPEHDMKRLLGAGFPRVFQVCRCFRSGELTDLHNPEFTMLEWYRAYASYREIAQDTEAAVSHVARSVLGTAVLRRGDREVDLSPPWPRLSVDEAFATHAGVELNECPTADRLRCAARTAGCSSIADDDTWEDVFFKVLIDRVEPCLAELGCPVFLVDYPAQLAALAKLHSPGARLAERLEVFVAGVELANGYSELNDPREQRRRFMSDRTSRRLRAGVTYPLDEAFLRAMAHGIPPAGGMALGLDRLVMLLTGAATVHQVVAFSGQIEAR